jgi:hypothetical protein
LAPTHLFSFKFSVDLAYLPQTLEASVELPFVAGLVVLSADSGPAQLLNVSCGLDNHYTHFPQQ